LSHHNTVYAQLLKFISRHEFETLAKQHHQGRTLRKISRWSQFIALGFAQLSGRNSLRDIVSNLGAQMNKLYHLGTSSVSRSSLARVNEQQPYTLYEALFNKLLTRCQSVAPKHGFRFKNKLYSLDASTIDLCLSVFPWAKFRTTKGAIKLHVGLDHSGYLPAFVTVTDGKVHDVTIGRTLKLPKDSLVVFDRGYTDYKWFNLLNNNGIFFVTRQKTNATYEVVERHTVSKKQGLTSDQTIKIKGSKAKDCPIKLRRIGYRDAETGKHYVFLTNNFTLAAKTIADIYKARWQIELFFKWVKQNLKIKTFLGTSKNAVLTQIWIAMCMYLLLAYIKFCNGLAISFQQIIRLLQLNLFERRDLIVLLKGNPPGTSNQPMQSRLKFT
jgi:putative transposase